MSKQKWIQKIGWVIPQEHNGSFVVNMEKVLDVYKQPYDPQNPVVCMDESPKELIEETRIPIPASPGETEKTVLNTGILDCATLEYNYFSKAF